MTNTIELTDVIEPRSIKRTLLVFTLKLAVLVAVAGLGYLGSQTAIERAGDYYQQAKAWALSHVTRVEVVQEYIEIKPQELPIERLVERAANKHQVPALLMRALILQESGYKLRTDRVRYEPHLQKRFKREAWMTDMEHQAMASSWGLGQIIYGIWKDFCKLESYADLLDPARNLDCSASIIRDCLRRRAGVSNKATRFRQCLKEYNGGDTYASQVEAHLVELVLGETL